MRATFAGRHERGAVALLTAFAMVGLLLFLAVVAIAGHGTSVRGELQNGSDSAALAGARELNGQLSGVASARQVAQFYAARHDTDTTLQIDVNAVGDVNFCHWDPVAREISWCLGWGVAPTSAAPPAPTPGAPTALLGANALQVRDGREAARGNPLPTWLHTLAGARAAATMDARSAATAIGGGPSQNSPTDCVLPITYIDCAFAGSEGVNCGASIVYRNDNTDTAGFTNLNDSTGGVGNPEIIRILNAASSPGACQVVTTGQVIDVKNGNVSDNNVWRILGTFVGRQFSVPVVHSDTCKLNQQLPIIGFASILITGVYRSPNNVNFNTPQQAPPEACASVTPCITGTITCDQSMTGPPGGGFFGVSTLTTRLVHNLEEQ
jgi:hypothetical protein